MIAETIQLALAPVFLMVAIASILNMLTVRLGRVVDRSRQLQSRHGETEGMAHDQIVAEMRIVARRIDSINRAMLVLVLSAMLIGLTVVALFFDALLGIELAMVASAIFVAAIALMMAGLFLFLRETREASAALRIPKTFLELDRDL
ncbi:DUF2721 domain-containing protein [Erythrobacter sp. HKB08]|uniref:DUF2721 domain-containing protein n=1 Tax=Erythrobacter sp. HKB08 TaxID=2502843 RepID=UPI001008B46C|nr:DUF2721 domain-containing protein [Erythrobacter sp. HKB08]